LIIFGEPETLDRAQARRLLCGSQDLANPLAPK
jgi:hypothetical protein